MQELDVTVADAEPGPYPSVLPEWVTGATLDGVPVYFHDMFAGPAENTNPWFSLVVRHERVDVEVELYNTVAEHDRDDDPPNQRTLDACNSIWGKARQRMAQAVISSLR